ncbi:hypothetical protein HQ531_12025, partial [bacterium]|nr:hypothetical protein [bacterium]
MIKVRAGVDIGGTKIRIGLINGSGELVGLADKIAMSQFEQGDDLMSAIADTIKNMV